MFVYDTGIKLCKSLLGVKFFGGLGSLLLVLHHSLLNAMEKISFVVLQLLNW